jgi:hypothetical protein
MTDSGPQEETPAGKGPEGTLPDWAVGLLTVQAIALLIGLAMPITPSKTGSTWSPAQLFSTNPSYLTEVAVYFVMTNLLIAVIGLVAWVLFKFKGSS